MEAIINWFADVFERFTNWIMEFVKWVFQNILDALAAIIEAIPVPDFVSNASNLFSQIPGEVAYFLHFFAIPQGITMILSAYALRFVLRRIPFIG